MTEKEYRENPAISRSQLWLMHEIPEKFLYKIQHPEEPTDSLLFGQMIHMLLLQPDEFYESYAVYPNIKRNTKEGKLIWAEFQEANPGKQYVSEEDFVKASEMVAKLLCEPFAKKLLNGEREVPFFWTDEMTGIDCKCRCDCLTEIGGELWIVDYKTTKDASTDGFTKKTFELGYDLQAAMYSEGVKVNTGKTPKFVFLAQEKDAPYSINVIDTDELVIARGYNKFREYLGTYKYCKETGNFYGYMGKEHIANVLCLPSSLASKE